MRWAETEGTIVNTGVGGGRPAGEIARFKPPFVMRFALAGWANERAAAAVRASRSLAGAFMPDLAA